MDNREAALALAAAGLAVFPCKGSFGSDDDDAKRPMPGMYWRKLSTTDARQVERWWSQWPGAIPAIDLAKSSLYVVDCDLPKRDEDADGVSWFRDLAQHNAFNVEALPRTVTLRGGWHVFFRQPSERNPLGNGRGSLPAKNECGVDGRGAGGFVIGPGASLPDGRRYAAVGSIASAPQMPGWLEDILRGSPPDRLDASPPPQALRPQASAPVLPPPNGSSARIAAYAEAGVEEELRRLRSEPEGDRNNVLNIAAFSIGQMVGAGWVAEADAQGWLETAAHDCGLVKDDGIRSVRATIRSGLGKGRLKPRKLPPEVQPAINGASVARQLIEHADGTVTDEDGVVVETKLIDGLETFTADIFEGLEVPPRQWHVPDLVPAGTVTLLSGDGGTGKSLLALQLAAATAAGGQWVGRDIAHGPVLYLSAEDEGEEIHRRLSDIAKAEGVSLADLSRLMIVPLAGKDAVIAALDRKTITIQPMPLWRKIEAVVRDWLPSLVIFDTLADFFAGDENSRMQARQFVQLLRGMAIKFQTTIILISHPSLAGISSGTGTSGSTAWSNSVRSRLYLNRVMMKEKTSDEIIEADPDLRVLSNKKANYSQRGAEVRLRWEAGVFVSEEGVGPFGAANRIVQADMAFLNLLRQYDLEGRVVSAARGPNYAPAIFEKDQRSCGITRHAFGLAMNRLFEAGRLQMVAHGPPSRGMKRLIELEAE